MATHVRDRRRIVTVNGVFDDFHDTTYSGAVWEKTIFNSSLTLSFTSAPGGAGGNALRLQGAIAEDTDSRFGGASGVRNQSYNYTVPPLSPYFWKNKAEFRMYIVNDEGAGTPRRLCHCAGFLIEGNAQSDTSTLSGAEFRKTIIAFNVANSVVGVGSFSGTTDTTGATVSELDVTAWPGAAYDTWFDVKITWDYDFFTDPDGINIEVFIGDVSLFTFTLDFNDQQRSNQNIFFENSFMGRAGPGLCSQMNDVTFNGNTVDVYYKDIWITNDVTIIDWELENSILQGGSISTLKASFKTTDPLEIPRGSDIQMWLRNSTSDDWVGHVRGITHQPIKVHPIISVVAAEGYEGLLFQEKTDKLTFTAQTAGAIVAGAINNPTKEDFDSSTFFDADATTYNRTYLQQFKTDIMLEMAGLAGFIIFLDAGLNWHFESPRTNELSKHLIWGQSQIFDAPLEDVYIRQPNFIRVFGSGVMAERELSVTTISAGARVIRVLDRPDLTTQADVDDALDAFVSAVRDPVQILKLDMVADYDLTVGSLIKVTIAPKNINEQEFLIIKTQVSNDGTMSLVLVKLSPDISVQLSELNRRTGGQESKSYAQDTVDGEDRFFIEGVGTLQISARYVWSETSDSRTGQATITNDCIDILLDVLNNTASTQPSHFARGTGSTVTRFDDTTLDTESARPALTATDKITGIGQDISGGSISESYIEVRFRTTFSGAMTVRELGLFNAAGAGTMFCRAVFTSDVSPIGGSWSADLIIKIIPLPGIACPTFRLVDDLLDWFDTGTLPPISHIAHIGAERFAMPSPWITGISVVVGLGSFVPDVVGKGTFSKSLLKPKSMIKYQFEYTYDFAADVGGLGTDMRELGIALHDGVASRNQWQMVMFRRTANTLQNKDGFECLWIIWLKIVRALPARAS